MKKNSELLIDKFVNSTVPRFSEFSNSILRNMSEFENYFHKKVAIGRKSSLSETIILQSFSECQKLEYKNILIVNAFTNTTEWYRSVT